MLHLQTGILHHNTIYIISFIYLFSSNLYAGLHVQSDPGLPQGPVMLSCFFENASNKCLQSLLFLHSLFRQGFCMVTKSVIICGSPAALAGSVSLPSCFSRMPLGCLYGPSPEDTAGRTYCAPWTGTKRQTCRAADEPPQTEDTKKQN